MKQRKEILNIELTGKDPELWQKLRPKLIQAIHGFFDEIIDEKNNSTIREELKKFTGLLLDNGKQNLQKVGFENARIAGEIEYLFAKKEKDMAKAEAIRFDTSLNKLKLYLGAAKILVTNDKSDGYIFITEEIDALLMLVNELQQNRKYID